MFHETTATVTVGRAAPQYHRPPGPSVRFLVLSNFYPPRVLGGYELVCEGVVDHLRRSGHEVQVLAADDGDPVPGQDHVHRELTLYIEDAHPKQPHPVPRLPREIADHRALAAMDDWDVALVFHPVGLAKSLLTTLHERGPVAYVLGDVWPAWDLANDTWLGRLHPGGPPGTPEHGIRGLKYPSMLARALAPLARRRGVPTEWPDLFAEGHWWANSEWTLAQLADRKALPLADPRVIRHGIPLDEFPARAADPGGRRLLYVGRITEQKGVDIALRALEKLPGAELTLVGAPDPDYVAGLELSAAAELREPVARDRLAAIYAEHDAVLFPVRWNEPLGLVPLEAMAVGVPVVATGTGGSSEYLVHERNCLLVEPGDADALAAAADRLFEDEALRRTLVAHGRETAEANSMEATATGIEAAAREIAAP